MGFSVCIVSPGNLASNPRVLKEADALYGAGYDVTAIVCDYNDALRQADDAIEASVPWKVIRVPRARGEGLRARAFELLARTRAALGLPVSVSVAALSARTPVGALMRRSREIVADLYIAHYVAALPAVAAAGRRHRALIGFDAEDFHSGEGGDAPDDEFRMRMIRTVEGAILPSCAYLTAAAPLIAEAYARRYGIASPVTVLNVFPLSMAPQRRRPAEAVGAQTLRAYWFSQTIGLDRGLQSFIKAMSLTRTRVTLDVRGSNRWGHGDALVSIAASLGLADRVRILPMAPPSEMVRLAGEYDVGLSLETDVSENRRICLTNKIFTYLLAGVPVIMSDTPAQRLLAPELGPAGRLCRLDDPAGLGTTLDELASAPRLAEASQAAWDLGHDRYNWDREKNVLLQAVAAAFAGRKRGS